MSTIDKFMIRPPTSGESKRVKSISIEEDYRQGLESDFKNTKSGKRKKILANGKSGKKFRNDGSIAEIKCPSHADDENVAKTSESITEISYEEYLVENCSDQEEIEDDSPKADVVVQNEGRDIRNYFFKGHSTFKEQKDFATMKVQAEIHIPSQEFSALQKRDSPTVSLDRFTKLKGSRRKGVRCCMEITDDDLVIECLDVEPAAEVEKSCHLVSGTGTNIIGLNGLDHVQQDVHSSFKGGIGPRENNPKETRDGIECLVSNPEVEQQNMNDVLMGKFKKGNQARLLGQRRNPGGGNKAEIRKAGKESRRDSDNNVVKSRKMKNAANENDVFICEATGDDEETRVYASRDHVSQTDQTQLNLVDADPDKKSPSLEKGAESNIAPLDPESAAKITQPDILNIDQPDTIKSEGKELRRSQRQSALIAMSVMSRTLQDLEPKRLRKNILGDGTKQGNAMEVDCLCSDAEEETEEDGQYTVKSAKGSSKSKSMSKAVALAPIFLKPSVKDAAKKSTPKLSAAEEEALRMRRNFLLSGVPEELKRMQSSQLVASSPASDAPFPNPSHTSQSDSAQENLCSAANPWKLPDVLLKLKEPVRLDLPSVANRDLNLFDLDVVCKSKSGSVQDKTTSALIRIPDDVLPTLLSEVKLHNPSFPTDKIFHQLKSKRNLEKTKLTVKSAEPMLSELKTRKSRGRKSFEEKTEDNFELKACEGILWTEKYAPSKIDEVIGNWDTCKKLRDWLNEWKKVTGSAYSAKLTRDGEDTTSNTYGDFEASSNDSNYSGEVGTLCNTTVLIGPSGVGKTSMVFALAQELDFKVFEVNSSSCRDGRYVLAQLQEATQSHQVSSGVQADNSARNSHEQFHEEKRNKEMKPKTTNTAAVTFLSNWSARQSMLENKKSSSKKKIGIKDDGPFKKSSLLKKERQTDSKAQNQDIRRPSLILFDEVDNVLEEDCGFWSAIQTFMKTTKRPIILTASDKNFKDRFGGRFECFRLRIPQLINIASYAQIICLLENTRTDYRDILSLVESYGGDVRRTLLLLQYWIESGAACQHAYDAPVRRLVSTVPQTSVPATAQTDPVVVVANGDDVVCEATTENIDDDDFQRVVRRKRPHIRINSDDETSGQRSTVPSPVPRTSKTLDDLLQDNCSVASSDVEFPHLSQGEIPAQIIEEIVEGLQIPLHRLGVDVAGGDSASICSCIQKVSGGILNPQFCGNHRHQRSSIFDDFIDHFETSTASLCSSGPGTVHSSKDRTEENSKTLLRTLCDAYKDLSFIDVYRSTAQFHDLRKGIYGDWGMNVDCASVLADTFESLVLSKSTAFGTCIRPNQTETAVTSVTEIDHDILKNHSARIVKNITSVIEGFTERHFHQTALLSADYLPALRAICTAEELRKATVKRRRRFNHYLTTAFPTMKTSLFKNHTLQTL